MLGDCGAGRACDIIIICGLRNQQQLDDALTSAPANVLGG
jgi:hypothetical protein